MEERSYYNLTTPQRNIWNLQAYYENTSISNLCGAVIYDENYNSLILNKALNKLVEHQEGLRLRFCYEEDEVRQYVSAYEPEEFSCRSFASMDELDVYADHMAKTPMPMADAKMYRFTIVTVGVQTGVLLCANHLITDAWTFSILANEVEAYCKEMIEEANDSIEAAMTIEVIAEPKAYAGQEDSAEREVYRESDVIKKESIRVQGVSTDTVHSYISFITSEQKYLSSNRYVKDRAFWEEVYASKPEASYIKPEVKPALLPTANRYVNTINHEMTAGINEFCGKRGVSQAVLFESALFLYLSRINPETSNIIVGNLVLNRSGAEERKTAGMFISTMPLTVSVQQDDTCTELLDKITAAHMRTFRHQKYPYSRIADYVHKTHNTTEPLYHAMISYQNAQTDTASYTKWYSNGCSEVPFTMHIDNRDSADTYTATIDYQTEIFRSAEEVELLYQRLIFIIKQILENPEAVVSTVSILPPAEYQKMIFDFNDTAVAYPKDKCVHELFEEQAQKTPDQIALIYEDRQITYRQLDEMSNSLAHYLREEKGVKPNDIVPIVCNRTWMFYVAVIAILKSGGAFLSIDITYPTERIMNEIKSCDAKTIISNTDIIHGDYDIIDMNLFNYSRYKFAIDNVNTSSDFCYMIFTSGSTGSPKGLTIRHYNAVNFSNSNKYNVVGRIISNDECRFLSITNTIFDMFITECILPLINGLTIIFANDKEAIDYRALSTLCEKTTPQIIESTPTKLKMLMGKDCSFNYIKNFKIFILGGEELTYKFYKELKQYTTGSIFNNYGPAETTVWSSIKKVCEDITIGKPIANTQIYILDYDQKPLPIGVAGELCIAGDGVGAGYLNRPELTAEKFVKNPFATEDNSHGKIMYKTGDLARWREDGEIEYLGRIDTQVKIRGLRIELGEIESVMSSFDGIALTAAADKRDENNRQYLVGYYTSEGEIDERELRRHLSDKLPKYMVPNYFVRLDSMPMTASGKTDRKNLPVPDFAQNRNAYEPPRTDRERLLCELVSELLEVENIGVTDDFFELGGDSLKAIEYIAKAHNLGIEIALQSIFEYPTVRELCEFLDSDTRNRVVYDMADFDKYRGLLCSNVITGNIPQKKSLGNVLLTGATGFLGAHILDQLMQNESGKIYCLVRSNSDNDRRGRWPQILQYYFGDRYESEFGRRIIPIVGDIELTRLSDDIPKDVQTVIHTAATVKHYGSYEYFDRVNVQGTKHVIQYAKSVGAKLIHISTISVSGNSLADAFEVYTSEEEKFFDETSFYIHQPLDNVYVRSKFEAERAVLDACLDGLDAKIIRVGNLTNRASDLKFQPNYKENAFLKRVKAGLEFGFLPDYLMPLYAEFSPIDQTAEGVVKIAQYADEPCVFHLNSNKGLYFTELIKILGRLKIPMQVVDSEEFNGRLEQYARSEHTEYIYEAFQNDMDSAGKLQYDSNIHIVNDFTVEFLRRIGFEWEEIGYDYVSRYIEYFRKLGYLEV